MMVGWGSEPWSGIRFQEFWFHMENVKLGVQWRLSRSRAGGDWGVSVVWKRIYLFGACAAKISSSYAISYVYRLSPHMRRSRPSGELCCTHTERERSHHHTPHWNLYIYLEAICCLTRCMSFRAHSVGATALLQNLREGRGERWVYVWESERAYLYLYPTGERGRESVINLNLTIHPEHNLTSTHACDCVTDLDKLHQQLRQQIAESLNVDTKLLLIPGDFWLWDS